MREPASRLLGFHLPILVLVMGRRQRGKRRKAARPAQPRTPKPPLFRRLTSHIRSLGMTTVLLAREPRKAPGMLRAALLGLWRARGGGFYGLGFVITFVVLEVQTTMAQLACSTSFVGFVTEQLLEFVFRLAWNSLLNTFLALIWPVLLLNLVGGWGIALLVVGYFGYERILRPRVELLIPELRPLEAPQEESEPVLATNAMPDANAAGNSDQAIV